MTPEKYVSFTPPFGDLLMHLEDCCGGCPYCVELCAKMVEEAFHGDYAYIKTGVGMVMVKGNKEAVANHIEFVKYHRDHPPPWPSQKGEKNDKI